MAINCNERDWWVCECDNNPAAYGFYPCDIRGLVTEPDERWDGQHYMCYRCGEVFVQDTFEVVDRIDEERRKKNDEFFAAS